MQESDTLDAVMHTDAAGRKAAAVPAALGVKPLLSHLARSPSVSLRHRLLLSGPALPSMGAPT